VKVKSEDIAAERLYSQENLETAINAGQQSDQETIVTEENILW